MKERKSYQDRGKAGEREQQIGGIGPRHFRAARVVNAGMKGKTARRRNRSVRQKLRRARLQGRSGNGGTLLERLEPRIVLASELGGTFDPVFADVSRAEGEGLPVIQGQWYEDINGNGLMDPGEPGINGRTLVLLDQFGNVVGDPVATGPMDIDMLPGDEHGVYQFPTPDPQQFGNDFRIVQVDSADIIQTEPPRITPEIFSTGLGAPAQFDQGFDLFTTDPGTTHVTLPLPGQGDVRVPLQGFSPGLQSLGENAADVDTIVQRLESPLNPLRVGQSVTVPIELVALSLVSVAPVDLGGGLHADVHVRAGSEFNLSQQQGEMTIHRDKFPDGTFDSTLPVDFLVLFVEPGGDPNNPSQVIGEQFGRDTLQGDGVWSFQPGPGDPRLIDSQLATMFPSGDFHAGSRIDPTCAGHTEKVLSEEQGQLAAHGVLPAMQSLQIVDPVTGQAVEVMVSPGVRDIFVSSQDHRITDENFGNLFKATIAGQVFEDVNLNAGNDGEPPLAGVEVTASWRDEAGIPQTRTVTSQANGGFVLPGLMPGISYSISATTPFGTSSTTPPLQPVIPASGEMVELPAIGLAFDGSIHGYVFEDLNVNNTDDNEPRLEDVVVTLTWIDSDPQIGTQMRTTTTNRNGEYWFTELPQRDSLGIPITYLVSQQIPDGAILTTPATPVILPFSGAEAVATPMQGEAVQRAVTFPWWWQVRIDPVAMNGVDLPPETVMLQGTASIGFDQGIDLANPSGPPVPLVDPETGLPTAMPDGDFVFGFEVMEAELSGRDSQGNEIVLRLNDRISAVGSVLASARQGQEFITGEASFDVFFDVTITDTSGETSTIAPLDPNGNPLPIEVGMAFTEQDQIGRTDVRWMPTFFWTQDVGRNLLDIQWPHPLWDKIISIHAKPHVEVERPVRPVVNPTLAQGNAFEGSIHGIKFEDINGNGRRDDGEGPLSGVTVFADLIDPVNGNVIETLTTMTDENGEYWFMGLIPGAVYHVSEMPPEGAVQTTADPQPIFLGSGEAYVASQEQGREVQNTVTFPWWWSVRIDPVAMDGIDFPPETIMLAGDATLGFTRTVDGQPVPNDTSLVDRADGFPVPLPNGTRTWDTEILSMDLRGTDRLGREVRLTVSPNAESTGTLTATASPNSPWLTGEITFDLNFEMTIDGMTIVPGGREGGSLELQPVPVGMVFTEEEMIPRDDVRWMPAIFWASGLGRDLLDLRPPHDLWDKLISIHAMPHVENERPIRPVVQPDLEMGDVFLGSVHGVKFHDRNGNGMQDDGEAGMANIGIEAVAQVPGGGEHVVVVITNDNGEYWLDGLRVGLTYEIREVLPLGDPEWIRTTPPIPPLTIQRGVDFVNHPATGNAQQVPELSIGNAIPGSLHGLKFEDLNVNGKRDDGEPPLSGVHITIVGDRDGDGVDDMISTRTDENGEWWVLNVYPGSYDVTEAVPHGAVPTTPHTVTVEVGSGEAVAANMDQASLMVIVSCMGMQVGKITAKLDAAGGVTGGFMSTTLDADGKPSLDAAAEKCGEDSFNWHQIVTKDTMPPVDSMGNRLTPPYDDPPPGGYGDDPNTPGDDTQWADDERWYWDEGADPPLGTPGFQDGFHVDDNTVDTDMDGVDDTLRYFDFPRGPAGTELMFTTLLVSIKDGEFHSYHRGFDWSWSNSTGEARAAGLRQNLTEQLGPNPVDAADPITLGVQLPYDQFGHLMNRGGRCAATATINSFQYLENAYPKVYGDSNLLPGAGNAGDLGSSRDALDGGWTHDGEDRDGMNGCPTDGWERFWEAKVEWIDDFAPGTTDVKGQFRVGNEDPSGWKQGDKIENVYPTWEFLLTELAHGEDVEIAFADPVTGGSSHSVTLTSLKWDDMGDKNGKWDDGEPRKIDYLDPNDPSRLIEADLTELGFGALGFRWDNGANPAADVHIYYAFSESPKPISTVPVVPTHPAEPETPSSGEPTLQMGDAFRGSIHGFKFEDLNGNGRRDPGEPGMAGVVIQATGSRPGDPLGTIDFHTTETDRNGEFWITGLNPGWEYTVTEVAPDGSMRTTDDVPALLIESGTEFVATPEQADDVQRAVTFPWWWEVVIDPEPMFGVDRGPQRLMLEGDASIGFSEAVNVQTGERIDLVDDENGLPVALPDGTWTISTSIMDMELSGRDVDGNQVVLRLNQAGDSAGEIRVTAEAGSEFLVGDSSFDVFFDITVTDADGRSSTIAPLNDDGTFDSIRVGMTFTEADEIARTDVRWMPAFFWHEGLGRELLDIRPPHSLWDKLISIHAIPHVEVERPVRPVVEDTLLIGNTVPGSIHGFKFEDVNGDGQYDENIDLPLAGVTFLLVGDENSGQAVEREATTDENGEFWITGLNPGDYTVGEVVPDGFAITTGTSFHFTIESRVEFVWREGAAMLPADDPRREVVVGSELMFGNTVPGSIHGFKFLDANGDGFYEPDPGDSVIITVPDGGFPDGTTLTLGDNERSVTLEFDDDGMLIDGSNLVITYTAGAPADLIASQTATLLRDATCWEVSVSANVVFVLLSCHPPDTPLAGVDFELTGVDGMGNAVGPVVVTSDANGEFWIEDLMPGDYWLREMTELLPGHVMPSTPTEFHLTIDSRHEYVWREGAAMLEPDDPRHEVNVGRELMFGNFVKGSIHGYKFEDLNVNGTDDGEPRVPGVEIVLLRETPLGENEVARMPTDQNGEYWFEDLRPATYIVREVPPFGATPTTPVEYRVILDSGEEWVALAGQADLKPAQVEVVVGPRLAFGNAFEGSIHGYKFEDLDVDGVWDMGEPPVPGVTIQAVGVHPTDPLVPDHVLTTRTDRNGEYWFTWLRPGWTYTVSEVTPFGATQTTPTIPPLLITSGKEWVATPRQATDVLNSVEFPWWLEIEIQPVDRPDPVTLMPEGNVMITFGQPQNLDPERGPRSFELVDSLGAALEVPEEGTFLIPFTLHRAELADQQTGDVVRVEGGGRLVVQRDGDQLVTADPQRWNVDSFFDIFAEVELRDPDTGEMMRLTLEDLDRPLRIPLTFPNNMMPPDMPTIPADDVRWMPAIFWRTGLGRELLDDAGRLWDRLITIHAVPHGEPVKPIRTMELAELAIGNAYEGSIHGYKFEDLNVDGIRQPGEPPLAGVSMILNTIEPLTGNLVEIDRTRTDANGEYWFTWLTPGVEYFVTEEPPQGSVQTSVDPPGLFITSGKEWVATPRQGLDVLNAVEFPWWLQVEIQPVPDTPGGPLPPPQVLMPAGMTKIAFDDLVSLDPNRPNASAPIVDPDNGLPVEVPDGQWLSRFTLGQTELVDEQTGATLRMHGQGQVAVQKVRDSLVTLPASQFNVDSFFDIFVELEIPAGPATGEDPMILQLNDPDRPLRIDLRFPNDMLPEDMPRIPADDIRWMPTIFWASGFGRDLLDNAGNVWDRLISIHAVPHGEPIKPVRIMVDPRLEFGNAFEGSIHGYKFEDVNVNGVRDPGEPPIPGVAIHAVGYDANGLQQDSRWTETDERGEYWFTWLHPGLSYEVTETPPPGSIQTTSDPPRLFINSGKEWVATPQQAVDVLNSVEFPWWLDVVIDSDPGNAGGEQQFGFNGNAMLQFAEPINLNPQPGSAGSFEIVDQDGLPNEVPREGGPWLIPFELKRAHLHDQQNDASMHISGHGQVAVRRVGDELVTLEESSPFFVDSFFDVLVEFEVGGEILVGAALAGVTPGEGMRLTLDDPTVPVRVPLQFPMDGMQPIPARDVRWMPAIFWADGFGRDLLDDAGQFWDELISIHAVPHVEVEKPVRPMLEPLLAFGNAYEGSIHGYKFIDVNGNGIDDDTDGDGIGDEPRRAGVEIVLQWTDADGTTHSESTFTDANGEFWFTWLTPGIEYTVREVPPTGFTQSTADPMPLRITSGKEWVATPQQARDVQNEVFVPDWRVDIVLDPTPDQPGDEQPLRLGGEAIFQFGEPIGVGADNLGETFAIVAPDTGLPLPVPLPEPGADARWQIPFSMRPATLIDDLNDASLRMSGQGQLVVQRVRDQLITPDSPLPVIDSFFDIFVELTVPGENNEPMRLTLDGDTPLTVPLEFPLGGMPPMGVIPADDVRWMPAIFWATDLGRNLLDDAGQFWDELITIHAFPHQELVKPVRPMIDPNLAFGNTIKGSIHGYKFEDLNADGDDDMEPRIEGVTILLLQEDAAGVLVEVDRIRTDANGEYWFTDLMPGKYLVREIPPFGSFPTTPVEYEVTVAAGEEYVALDGQAMLGPNDPRVEINIGPELAFGNAYEGSIHGYKFEDLNVNGLWDDGEPALPGVQIELTWTDDNGVTQTQTTRTDRNGEYWFAWLRPGIEYTVTETPPHGSVQTTMNPDPILILSGQEHVATMEQGRAVQRAVSFPWWWKVMIQPVGSDGTLQPPEMLMLEGMATLGFGELIDIQTQQAVPMVDQNGLPLELPASGTFTADVSIMGMELSGTDSTGRRVVLRQNSQFESLGQVVASVDPETGFLVGRAFMDSFFDITFSVGDPDDPASDNTSTNAMTIAPLDPNGNPQPVRLSMDFTAEDEIARTDIRWMPAILWREGIGQQLLDIRPPHPLWDRLISIHTVPHVEIEKPVRTVTDEKLAFGNAFEGSIHGYKFEDLNGDGIWDDNEPPLPGVVIHVVGTHPNDPAAPPHELTAVTNRDGEYWFEWLRPGWTYSVSEVAPAGSFQTTDQPEEITIGSGQEYVATPAQGRAVQRSVSFPWWWEVVIQPAAEPGQPQPPRETLMLEGMATIGFSEAVRVGADAASANTADSDGVVGTAVQNAINETFGLVNSQNGLPLPLPVGSWQIQTSIMSMELSGQDSQGRVVTLRLNDERPSTGRIRVTAEQNRPLLVGDSFFDVHFELEFDNGEGPPMIIAPQADNGQPVPIEVGMVFTPEDAIARTDVRWMPTFFWRSGIGQDLLDIDPPHEFWDRLISIHAVPHVEIEKPIRPVVWDGLAFGNAFFGSVHGYKFLDENGNGRDDDRDNDGVGDEPRIDGVMISLSGIDGRGNPVNRQTTTGDNPMTTEVEVGEYWLTDLPPGRYTVTETPPNGTVPTTPVSYDVQVQSRQELVALRGQSHIDPNDPRVEVFVGPRLAFGNRERPDGGSIHGLKWLDANGNGEREPGERGLADWEIVIRSADGSLTRRVFTMPDDPATAVDETGMYWVDGLPPGEYLVSEILLPGWEQTFPDTGAHSVVVVDGQATEGVDFGNRRADRPVRIRLQVSDANGQQVGSTLLNSGEELFLDAYVEDLRNVPRGVFAAYLDVLFDSTMVNVGGTITYGPNYASGQAGDTTTPGLVNEIGAFDGSAELGGGEFLLFRVPVSLRSAGLAEFFPNQAEAIDHEVLVYQGNERVPATSVDFVGTSLTIHPQRPWQNQPVPEDVNDDGDCTALDALLIINEINAPMITQGQGSEFPMPNPNGPPPPFFDVNGDGILDPGDVLAVVNKLNNETQPASLRGEGELLFEVEDAVQTAPPIFVPTINDRALLSNVFRPPVQSDLSETTRGQTVHPARRATEETLPERAKPIDDEPLLSDDDDWLLATEFGQIEDALTSIADEIAAAFGR